MLNNNLPNQTLLYFSIFCAGTYYAFCENKNSFTIAAKVASAALLTCYRHQNKKATESNLLTYSLACHAAGDLLIELSENTFVLALMAFFIGHGFYAKQLNHHRIEFTALSKLKIASSIILAIYASWFANLLVSKTDDIVQKAIPLYCSMLFLVMLFALMQKEKSTSATISAALYAASDNLIGTSMFLPNTFENLTAPLPQFFRPLTRISFPLYFAGQVGAVILSQQYAQKTTLN